MKTKDLIITLLVGLILSVITIITMYHTFGSKQREYSQTTITANSLNNKIGVLVLKARKENEQATKVLEEGL